MILRELRAVATQAFLSIVSRPIHRLVVRIVASAAPEPVVAPFPTQAAPQLLRLANHSQRSVVPGIADEYSEGLFERFAGRDVAPVPSRIQNARLSLEVALLADAVSGIGSEARWADNIGSRSEE